MQLNPLSAISPIDGRYRSKTEIFDGYFSEFALIRYRLKIEVEYLIALSDIPDAPFTGWPAEKIKSLRQVYEQFGLAEAAQIKAKEAEINHDVKAVEYYLKAQLPSFGLEAISEFVHFGLTSQDINNTATPLMIKDALQEVLLPELEDCLQQLDLLGKQWLSIPMLARTHGQPASPTRLGKEILVFKDRIQGQLNQLKNMTHSGKFGGATGNFNAHYAAFPGIDWIAFSNRFLEDQLHLKRQQFTTQIEHYDGMAALFDTIKRINVILKDLCRDCWTYISMDYFKQKIKANEVGSSAMPHKVNPIDFENAEGNLGIANALFAFLSEKLPVSRLQRDLTDSTVSRNIGIPFAHTLLALKSLSKGLSKLKVNETKIATDLDNNWAVLAEAIQTILRREAYPKPYEKLKELTRTGKAIDKKAIHDFIDKLEVTEKVKEELRALSPSVYVGKNPE